jgi:predicted glycoside hydrolase/deacetylase ChbG (UPF0249 family)
MMRILVFIVLIVSLAAVAATAQKPAEVPELLIRTDDVGMSHTVNLGVRKMIETGIPFSASVMIACPWYLEAAEILRDSPQVSVGIHLTLNSEWEHYKWGPVLGSSRVPSLVDENGHFHTTGEDFAAADIDLDEVRAELRAQIERALRAGLDVDYLDYHMGTAASTPELLSIVEDLASEHGLGLSRYFGEPSASLWHIEPDEKLTTLLDVVQRVESGRSTLLVMHLGLETPEMEALVDINNPSDPYRVAEHRQAELDAITSPAFRRAAAERQISFVTYADLIERHGLEAMRRPESGGYSMGDAEE